MTGRVCGVADGAHTDKVKSPRSFAEFNRFKNVCWSFRYQQNYTTLSTGCLCLLDRLACVLAVMHGR